MDRPGEAAAAGARGVALVAQVMGLLAALPLLALPCAAAPAAVAPPVVLVTLDRNFTRGVPLLGFGNELAWQRANDSALAAAVAAAGSAVARYPGGTPSNFWDWRSGCSCTCPLGGCWDPVRTPTCTPSPRPAR